MVKVFATLLQFPARTLQFLDVTIELLDVSLSLFGAFTFSVLGLCRSRADVFEIFFVCEVNDRDDRQRRQHRVKTDRAFELDDTARYKSADEVGQRRPKVIVGPRLPDWTIGLTRQADRNDPRVGCILANRYGAQEHQ